MNHEEQNIKINKDKWHNSGKGHEDLDNGEIDTGDNGNSCFITKSMLTKWGNRISAHQTGIT